MRRANGLASFGPLFLSIFLVASTALTRALHAQAPAAGASVTVRMLETIDSNKDPAGQHYRAAVTKAVDAGNGVTILQGAVAAVTLVNSGNGSGWTTQLVSVTVNGQPVAVTSAAASVATPAQSAAAGALSSMSSVLARSGHRVNAPAAAIAVASGQRIMLPAGATLSFVLSQPLAANPAAPAANPASNGAMVASSGPAQSPVSASPAVAAPGQHWWMCRYVDQKDPNKAAAGSRMYFSVLPSSAAFSNDHGKHFNAYVQQNYKITDPNSAGKGFCTRVSDDAAGRANSMDMFQKQWRSSNMEPIQVSYADTPAQDAAIDAKLASSGATAPAASQPSSSANSKECAYHANCTPPAPKP